MVCDFVCILTENEGCIECLGFILMYVIHIVKIVQFQQLVAMKTQAN